MTRLQSRAKITFFVALILTVEWILYFRHAGHFFQGDMIFHLNHRATSLARLLERVRGTQPFGMVPAGLE